MNELELAWAAGFFEGEGTVSSATTRGKLRIRAAVTQNGSHAPELLERFVQAVGIGKVLGPYDYSGRYENGLTKQPRYVVTYQNRKDVTYVLELLRPFMTPGSLKVAKYEELRARVAEGVTPQK